MPEGNFLTKWFGKKAAETDPLEARIASETEEFIDGSKAIRQEVDKSYGAFWKLDTKDIADFYLLAPIVQNTSHAFSNDAPSELKREENQLIEHRLGEIGRKLAFSLLMTQVDEFFEYDKYSDRSSPRPSRLETSIQKRLDDRVKTIQSPQDLPERFQNLNDPVRVTVGILLLKMQEAHKTGDMEKVFEDKDLVFDCLRIFEEYQRSDKWVDMATHLRMYLFPHRGIDTDKSVVSNNASKNERDVFLMDRLISFAHTTGAIYSAITNDPLKAGFLLYVLNEEANWVSTTMRNASSEVKKIARNNRDIFGDYFHQQISPERFIDMFLEKVESYRTTDSLRYAELESIIVGFDDRVLVEQLMRQTHGQGKYIFWRLDPPTWRHFHDIMERVAKPDMMKLIRGEKLAGEFDRM